MLSDFEHWNINAKVFKDRVEETHVVNDPAKNRRRQLQTHTWHMEQFLGRGGFGEVRLQRNHETGKARAVKRISMIGNMLSKSECEKELEALMEFSKHKASKFKEAACFVEFYGWFTDGPEMFLAMEFVALGDLEKNLKERSGKVPELEARDIAEQILLGLEIMHALKFAHRDLKPQNVMVVSGPPRWWVKLADFGFSKRLTDTTGFHTRGGTQSYMAPEILNYLSPNMSSPNYTDAVDMWATGCIVYRLITGVVPFPPGTSLMEYCDDRSLFPLDPIVESGVRGGIVNFLRVMLAASPMERPSAPHALQHLWIKAEVVEQSPSRLKVAKVATASLSELTISDIGYKTASHYGLQSEANCNVKGKFQHIHSPAGTPARQQQERIPAISQTFTGEESRDSINSRLRTALHNGNQPLIQHLLDKGANIDESDKNRWTPLHFASVIGNSVVVQYLLDKGANIETSDKDGWTPLHSASSEGHLAIVQQLLDKGANIEASDEEKWTPLHSASSRGNLAVVQYLLEKGANVEAYSKNRWTPLHFASAEGRLAIVQQLLDKGANIEASNKKRWTPLHFASAEGHLAVVQQLLDKGANDKATTRDKESPFGLAFHRSHEAVIDLLRKRGSNTK